jgi:hypothetical protein
VRDHRLRSPVSHDGRSEDIGDIELQTRSIKGIPRRYAVQPINNDIHFINNFHGGAGTHRYRPRFDLDPRVKSCSLLVAASAFGNPIELVP